jgi:ABC-type glycerol-3-phosphate transport system substrate-binding protein
MRPKRYGFRGRLETGIFGAAALDPVTGDVTCNTSDMIDYFATNIRLFKDYQVSPSPEESQSLSQDINGLFRQERVAIMPLYTQRMAQAFEVFAGMDLGMTLLPKVKRQSQWASSQAITIYRGTKHPQEAWELFQMFQSKEFQMGMSVRSLPARLDLMDEALKSAEGVPQNFGILAKALDVMEATPRVAHLQELMAVFNRFSGRIFSFRLSPEEGMSLCETEMRRRIESFRKTDMISE